MIAHLAQLHEHVDDFKKVSTCKLRARGAGQHEFVVEKPLTFGQATRDHVLVLGRHLTLHILLQAPQNEGAQHRVKAVDEFHVHDLGTLHHVRQRLREPLFELVVVSENVGHKEMEE